MPEPLARPQDGQVDPTDSDCEVFRLQLDEPQAWVRVEVEAKFAFAYALRDGKAVAVGGPGSGALQFELAALGMETIVVCTLAPQSIRFCIRVRARDEEEDWRDATTLVSDRQIPIRQLMTTLGGPADEFSEAKGRLLTGETLDSTEFARLADTLRIGVPDHGKIRPIDQVLLARETTAESFEEMVDLDPLRVLMSHPKWRRILGFGLFDDDKSLVVGETYEYRVTAFFPERDLADRVYGFHTLPAQTSLPACFYLHDLRIDLPQPSLVQLAPGTGTTGKLQTSRRGIRLEKQTHFFWIIPSLANWSIVIGFPEPVDAVVLELDPGHQLQFAWRPLLGSLQTLGPVPPGARVRLDFPNPAEELRLEGRGFLYSIRLPAGGDKLVPLSVVLPPVTFTDAPRPAPPFAVDVGNLQVPQSAATDDQQPSDVELKHALGLEVRWRPASLAGLGVWPPDAETPPPIDAAMFEVEHNEIPSSDWDPLLSEENWMLGDREAEPSDTTIRPGADLMVAFPEVPPLMWSGGLDLLWRDVFDFKQGGNAIVRPVPAPGTKHRYRVWAVDPVGRRSLNPTVSGEVRLEKHVPPPVPVGPSEAAAASSPLPEPTGVQARVLVKDAPDLTAADRTLLGADDNAIVLKWGWHATQRDQDPFAREFRVYLADTPLDTVKGTLTAVTFVAPGLHDVMLSLDRAVVADAAKGIYLQAGYAFRIETHTAGQTITVRLSAKIGNPAPPTPQTGPIEMPLRITPDKTRPPAWSARVEVRAITAETRYQAVIRNRLTLTPAQPRDTVWVGVSAADDQFYVSDQLAPVQTRAGNESSIVPVICAGRYYGRPDYDVPPPMADVPVHRAPEPAERPLFFDLDLTSYLTGLSAVDLVQPYRAAVDAVLAAYSLTADNRIMADVVDRAAASEQAEEVHVPNPADRQNIIAGLAAADRRVLADRYVVFLAGSHRYRDRLFERTSENPIPFGSFKETLPNEPGRYVYRVRKADAAGHLSAGDAMAEMVLRVPSMAPGGSPVRETSQAADAPGTLRLRVPPDFELAHLLLFTQVAANGRGPLPAARVLRVPNRPDLYPADGIRMRAPDGEILVPQVKDLSDADVTLDGEGHRRIVFQLSAGAGERLRVWSCTLSRDSIPSSTAGPWSFAMPVPPLPVPMLTASGTSTAPNFTWTWPGGPTYNVALQASSDGTNWRRVSPLLAETGTSYAHGAGVAGERYRLAVLSPDGRTATSNEVTP